MLATFTFSPGSCIRCGGADGYELETGGVVEIFLDQDRNEAFPESIEGIITAVTQASVTDTSRTYTVQYETDDLEDSALLIAECDVSSLICTSWAQILEDQIDALVKVKAITEVIVTGNSTLDVQLVAGEIITSVIQTTAGSGIMLESITYAGDPPVATLTFTGSPFVNTDLQLQIQYNNP